MTRLLIGGFVFVVMALAANTADASIPGSDGKVHACYAPPGGPVRVIDTDQGQSCRPGETALEWPAALPAAPTCPAGTTLFLGVCFEAASRQQNSWIGALRDCADEGRRLPTHTELTAFRLAHPASPDFYEWSDHSEGFDRALSVSNSLFGLALTANTFSYRCVVPL